jgi:hypothetical protein
VLVRVGRGGIDTDGAPEEQHPASQGDAAPGNPDQVPGAVSTDRPARDGPELDGQERDGAAGGDGADGGRGVRVARAVEYRDTVERADRVYAVDQAYERVREVERGTVTPAMRRIEAEDPERHLAGLENRLKGKDRLTEKVEFDVRKKGVSADEAISNVKDAIRYTLVYPEERYTDGLYSDCERLEASGYELVERRNSWGKEQYKGINSRWRVPEHGQVFEVQFHTQASFYAKEFTHSAYEKLRIGIPTQSEQTELEDFQKQVTAQVPVPPRASDIPDYP